MSPHNKHPKAQITGRNRRIINYFYVFLENTNLIKLNQIIKVKRELIEKKKNNEWGRTWHQGKYSCRQREETGCRGQDEIFSKIKDM